MMTKTKADKQRAIERQRKRYNRLKAEGLCVGCGVRPNDGRRVKCLKCRKALASYPTVGHKIKRSIRAWRVIWTDYGEQRGRVE